MITSELTRRREHTVTVVDFTRWFLALFFLGVAAFYTLRVFAVARRIRISPVFAGHPGTLHWATHFTFRVFRVLILLVCVARLVWPGIDRYLLTFDALWHPLVLILGNVLLLSGFAVVVAIHGYMGEDWRSGTRAEERTRLITKGPFGVSRNPMMLCVVVAQLGLFLALPSLFTLVCLAAGTWAVTAQVGVEEGLLLERFGAQYEAYKNQTPRWLLRH